MSMTDRAGDCGRQHRVDHPRPGGLDEQTDEREHDAGDEDRADDVGGVAALGADRETPPTKAALVPR